MRFRCRAVLEACALGGIPIRCLALLLALGVVGCARDLHPALAEISREYSHRIWRTPDGLPQNRIQAISQTPDGYLWIGTSGGLVRFDGVRFFVFDRSNTGAFRDDSVLALHPSRDGSLWIGTEGGRLLHYRKGEFALIGADEGLSNGFVRALYEDPDGTLWIGTDRGFFRMRGGKVERLDGSAEIPLTAITSISADREGTIWAAGGIGLLMVANGVPRRFLSDRRLSQETRVTYRDHDGRMWLLTSGGVRRVDHGTIVRIPGLDGIAAMAITEDRDSNLWVGTLADGLLRVGKNGIAACRDPDVLPSQTVLATFEDREGNLWIGTSDGLLRLSKISVRVLTTRDGLADDNISSIYEGRDGSPWMATITGRIFQYRKGRVIPFLLPSQPPAMRYRVVYEDSHGVLWLGSGNDGILRISNGTARVFTAADGLRSNMIRQFLEDRQGQLWIALGSGLSRWDGRVFHNYYLEDGLSYGSVRILKEDRTGDLLVGTDSGLNRVRNGKFIADPAFAALDGERIWAIQQDRDGTLWIGTRGGGLFRIRNGRTARLTVRDGLLSNAIYQILDDGNGNFWISGPAGVFFAPQSELNRVADGHSGPVSVVPYGTAEGLESTHMNGGYGSSGFRSASGELWFPSVKGAVRIDPARIQITQPSPVLIESVKADENAIPVSGDIVLPPGHGKLEIHYTAANLRSPERIAFRHLLEGFDSEWTNASRTRTAYYTNLPPGRYRFRVAATDSAMPRQLSEAALPVVLRPHFYQTVWFYGLCAMAAALCVLALLRFYARQTRQRYALLFAERTRLAREMHDTVIQGCAGVSTLLEAAASLQPTSGGRAKELVDQARVQARLTLDEARQAVWDLRYTHLEGDTATTLHDFARRLSAEKGIPIEVEFSGHYPVPEERVMRTLLLVAREAIRNAANHADPRHIRIRIHFDPGEVRLEVVDDGRGFAPAEDLREHNGHYGIVGMRERVEQLGGDFLLRSVPSHGTSVVARLPLGGATPRRENVRTA